MNDQQLVSFAHSLGLVIKQLNERLKAAEQTIADNGLQIEVAAPSVQVDAPQISVEGPEIDVSALVTAITGLTTDNVAQSIEAVSQAISAIDGVDLTALVESQGEIAGAVTGSADKLLDMQERALEAQTKASGEISRLADLIEKSTGATQMQFTVIAENSAALQKQVAEQGAILASPKRLTFGADGQPVGVETVLRQ